MKIVINTTPLWCIENHLTVLQMPQWCDEQLLEHMSVVYWDWFWYMSICSVSATRLLHWHWDNSKIAILPVKIRCGVWECGKYIRLNIQHNTSKAYAHLLNIVHVLLGIDQPCFRICWEICLPISCHKDFFKTLCITKSTKKKHPHKTWTGAKGSPFLSIDTRHETMYRNLNNMNCIVFQSNDYWCVIVFFSS